MSYYSLLTNELARIGVSTAHRATRLCQIASVIVVTLLPGLISSPATANAAVADDNGSDELPTASPIGPHVLVLQSCSGAEGMIDVFLVNVHADPASYEVQIEHPSALPNPLNRSRQIGGYGEDKASFTVPGDARENYRVTVSRDGVEVHRRPVNPQCDGLPRSPESPEASVVSGCRDGGLIRALYVNQIQSDRDWSATLTSLTDRTQHVRQRERSAGRYERSSAVFDSIPDGVYQLKVYRGDNWIRSFYLDVDCVDPKWNTEPEQLRVLEVAYLPPATFDSSIVDQSTTLWYEDGKTIDALRAKIDSNTDRQAELLESGSRSNNGFGTQGIDITFVDRVEINSRPPVNAEIQLDSLANKISASDPRFDPDHPEALNLEQVRCAGEEIPLRYKFGHLKLPKASAETNWLGIESHEEGEGKDKREVVTRVTLPEGHCVYLSETFRPDYPEILENQVMALPSSQFSGAGRSFCEYVEDEQIDQVWIWTDHDLEIHPAEAVMSSRHGVVFNVANEYLNHSNGTRLYPQCDKTYTGLNFNYTRGPSVHNFMHAIEGLMSWNLQKASNADMPIFSWHDGPDSPLDQTFGAECGDTHWAPNVDRKNDPAEYHTAITTEAWSECFGWNPAVIRTNSAPNRLVHSSDSKVAVRTVVSCETWDGCYPDGRPNPTASGELRPYDGTLVLKHEVWWLRQLPGLGFEHLAQYKGEVYRVNSPWSILADPDRFLPDGATFPSMKNGSLMLADFSG